MDLAARDAPLRVEDGPSGVRVLTLHRPARRNAIDEAVLDGLWRALDPSSSPHVRVLLVRGHGGAFSAGYDLGALAQPSLQPGGALPDDRLGQVLARFAAHPAPSVALVEGPAYGAGFELAASCDFRVAAPSAVFCLPPAKLGIIYAEEGMAKVARLVGHQRARLLFLTGRKVDAPTAATWGLVDELGGSADDAEARAQALCRELADNAPLAVSGMRRALGLLARTAVTPDERRVLREARREAFASPEAAARKAAFFRKG